MTLRPYRVFSTRLRLYWPGTWQTFSGGVEGRWGIVWRDRWIGSRGRLGGGGFIRTEGGGSRIWKVMEEQPLAGLHTLHVFAHFGAVRAILGNLQVCRGRHWATVGDPPYKDRLSLLPGNLLPERAKSLPVSASVGGSCRRRRRRWAGRSRYKCRKCVCWWGRWNMCCGCRKGGKCGF